MTMTGNAHGLCGSARRRCLFPAAMHPEPLVHVLSDQLFEIVVQVLHHLLRIAMSQRVHML